MARFLADLFRQPFSGLSQRPHFLIAVGIDPAVPFVQRLAGKRQRKSVWSGKPGLRQHLRVFDRYSLVQILPGGTSEALDQVYLDDWESMHSQIPISALHV